MLVINILETHRTSLGYFEQADDMMLQLNGIAG
jgi:hypothetical protein